MRWCTLLWLCLTFVAFLLLLLLHFCFFIYFIPGSCFCSLSHLASFRHLFSQDWRTSTEAEACHTFLDLAPRGWYDRNDQLQHFHPHMVALHSVSVSSPRRTATYRVPSCRNTSPCVGYVHVQITDSDICTHSSEWRVKITHKQHTWAHSPSAYEHPHTHIHLQSTCR